MAGGKGGARHVSPTARWLLLLLFEVILVVGTSALSFALAGRRGPLEVFRSGIGRIFSRAEYRGPIILVLLVTIADVIESQFDDSLTGALGYEMTDWIHRLEGDWASRVQGLEWLPATWLLTFAYIIVLPVLLAAPIVLAAAEEKRRTFRALSLGLVINYLAGLPFYFLFPVREMWAGNPDHVRLLMDRVSPAIMESYRENSALDNCFPSLHTSLALTVPLIIGRTWGRPFAAAAWAAAIGVVFSTLYLGIHWASDIAAGVLLAVLAARLAQTLARRGDGP